MKSHSYFRGPSFIKCGTICNQNRSRLFCIGKHLSKPSQKWTFLFWYSASKLLFL